MFYNHMYSHNILKLDFVVPTLKVSPTWIHTFRVFPFVHMFYLYSQLTHIDIEGS